MVGVIGRFGEDVVMLEELVVVLEECGALDDGVLEVLEELFRLELEESEDLELDEDLLDICVLDCCWSCCRHFALRFLNQTW